MSQHTEKTVVILGGGLTGLSAGYELSQNGYRVTVLEKEEQIGGLASSIDFKDCRFDFGPHAFSSKNQELYNWYKEKVQNQVYFLEKNVQIKFQGTFFHYPLRPLNVLGKLRPVQLVKCVVSFVTNKFRKQIADVMIQSAEDLYISLYGKELYKLFFKTYTEKVWGFSPAKLSAHFLRHRLPNLNLTQMIWNALYRMIWKKRALQSNADYTLKAMYAKAGSIAVPRVLADRILRSGSEVLTDASVDTIHWVNGQITGIDYKSAGQVKNIQADWYINTIPITSFFRKLSPPPNSEVVQFQDRVRYRSILIFCIIVKKPQLMQQQAIYYYDRFFTRIGYMNSYSPDIVPEGKSAITVEVTCFQGDDIWNAPEDELFERVLEDLMIEDVIMARDEIEDYTVWRNVYGYPIPFKGYEHDLYRLWKFVHHVPNLFSGGRQGLFAYIGMNNAIESGRAIAQCIVQGGRKPPIDFNTLIEEPLFV